MSMMTKMQVITELAEKRIVEHMVASIAHQDLSPDLQDLSQMVYGILLDYEEEIIIDLWEHNQMSFFIARIILNQYRSRKSAFFNMFHKEQIKSVDIADFDFEEDCDA